jgi:hypothetical protein
MENFNFCFKGDRTYVHGSDIYNSITKYLKANNTAPIGPVELSIHRLMTHNMVGEIMGAEQSLLSLSPPVIYRFTVEGVPKTFFLSETDKRVDCRYEYDEESITRPSQVSADQNYITVHNKTPYSSIEVIIALNKKLVQAVFAGEKGKWLFTKLLLKGPLPEVSDAIFTVTFSGGLSHRLTRSKVAIDGAYCGEIFFTLVKG